MPYERSNCLKHLIPLTIQLRRVLRIISKDEFDNQYEKKFDPHSFGTFSTLVLISTFDSLPYMEERIEELTEK